MYVVCCICVLLDVCVSDGVCVGMSVCVWCGNECGVWGSIYIHVCICGLVCVHDSACVIMCVCAFLFLCCISFKREKEHKVWWIERK